MTDNTHSCSISKPTIADRLWKLLGYGWRPDENVMEWRLQDPPPEGFAIGVFHTETHVHLDWKDRLRVLLSGHLVLDAYSKTDVTINKAMTLSEVSVLRP